MSALHERLARAQSATLAGELLRRSAPELGHDGLAQKLGHRTPQKLIQATTGATSRDAAQAVRVGGLAESHPWLGAVARAVAERIVSTDAADAIRAGLGAAERGCPGSSCWRMRVAARSHEASSRSTPIACSCAPGSCATSWMPRASSTVNARRARRASSACSGCATAACGSCGGSTRSKGPC